MSGRNTIVMVPVDDDLRLLRGSVEVAGDFEHGSQMQRLEIKSEFGLSAIRSFPVASRNTAASCPQRFGSESTSSNVRTYNVLPHWCWQEGIVGSITKADPRTRQRSCDSDTALHEEMSL